MRPSNQDVMSELARLNVRWAEREVAEAEAYFADARTFNTDRRQKLAKEGKALSDGSYPIPDADALRRAAILAASGHGNVSAAKALIRKRAKELGVKLESLPGFGSEKSARNGNGNGNGDHDQRVLKSIEDALDLQRRDPDLPGHDADRRVLGHLNNALEEQHRDMATDAPPKGGNGLY